MDVHRCRFIPYPPSPINAAAFSHSFVPKSQKHLPVRLAIGRANGDIEIWNPLNGSWLHESTLHGAKDRSIDGLVWAHEPDQDYGNGNTLYGKSRLFSIGYTAAVTEWDLEKKFPRHHASGQHGDIWCFGLQPRTPQPKNVPLRDRVHESQKLVAGTIDGSLVVYTIEDDSLRFEKVLVRTPKKKVKMVSLTFQSRNIVVVGCSGGIVGIYDMRNGSTLRKMTLSSQGSTDGKDIIIWSVKCLPNSRGDIVTGDSAGQVCIWNGKTYTLMQRIHGHNQDVLSLAISFDGSTIASGGMDRRTVIYRKKTSGQHASWGKVMHRRYHDHDVKAMASFESNKMSVIVSGGPDAYPVVMPLKEAGLSNHTALSHLPQTPNLVGAPQARIVLTWWGREVHIWKLKKEMHELVTMPERDRELSKTRKCIATILIRGEANISSASISTDGTLLVVATAMEVKAFRLSHIGKKGKEVTISEPSLPESVAKRGSTMVQVSPDGQWICAVKSGNKLCMVQIRKGVSPRAFRLNRLKRNIPKHIRLGALGGYDRSISHIAFSPDSRMVAVSDLSGYIDTWVLHDSTQNGVDHSDDEEDPDSSSDESEVDNDNSASPQTWTRNPSASLIPKLPNPPTVLSFSPHTPTTSESSDDSDTDDYVLLVVTASRDLLLFNPTIGRLASWSRRNPTSKLPEEWQRTMELAKGCFWHDDRVWIYGTNFLCMIDTTHDFESPASIPSTVNGKKRKRRGAGGEMKDSEALGARKVQKLVQGKKSEWVDVVKEEAGASDDEDEDEVDAGGEVLALRTRKQENTSGEEDAAEMAEKTKQKGFWLTRKYRPILGIVKLDPVAGLNSTGAETGQAFEIALVERPAEDIDMPDRGFGDDDWER